MVKVTFTLDDATVQELRRTAARLRKPQSLVVREAVAEYSARTDRLSERERLRMLAVIERAKRAKPTRTQADVDAEIAAVRAARRTGGRRHPAE
jgi:Arc/MetJ-type ribon-helix-helix transcriptional regulator